jgi:hypothetical protein
MLLGGVVGHEVDHHAEAAGVCLRQQDIGVRQRAKGRVDVAVVADVVAAVHARRGVERRQPDRVDAELREVVQPGDDPRQVPDTVAVGVREAARIDLVDHCRTPPRPAVGLLDRHHAANVRQR